MATMHESASRLRVAARSVASPPTLSLIALTPGNQQVAEGAWGTFHAAAVWSDGTREDVTQRCAWSSSDRDVVSVGTPSLWRVVPGLAFFAGEWPGQYIARKQGAATVTCAYQGLSGSVAVIVGPLMEIDLDQETPLDPKDEKTPDKKDEKKPPKVDKPDPKKEEIIVAIVPPIEQKEMTKEEKLEELEKKKEEPPPVPPPPEDKKIAVQQHQDKEEEPNPEAHYLAEKNHKVKPGEETQAQITSTSENDKNPTPGTHNGPGKPDQPGNGDKTIVAQDENRPGEKVAPNVVPKGAAPKQETVAQPDPPKSPGSEKGDDKKPTPSPTPEPTATAKAEPKPDGKGITAPVPAPAAGAESENGDPALAVGPKATPTVPSAVPPGAGDGKAKALPTLPGPKGPKWVGSLGYGAKGEKGKPSISIDEKVAKAAIGMDALDKLKKVEGETKLSMHRGQWKSSSLEKWRAAIENYVPGVKPGNQTNLGTAAAPWATYLAQIHVRLHPIFAEGFVDGLGDLPAGHPLNDKSLVTRMEIVIKPDGTLHHLGIVKASGVTAFDIAALDSVDRAAPFGKVPQEIISPDGLAYLHWEFHRDEMRCSNVNAYPYVLKEGGQKAPDPKAPPPLPTKPPEGAPKLPTGTTMGAIGSPNG